jgi:site-specific recombinase XerD
MAVARKLIRRLAMRGEPRTTCLGWFASESPAELTRQAVNYIVRLAGEKAKLGRVWPHMLLHS